MERVKRANEHPRRTVFVEFCPRCDKPYSSDAADKALNDVIYHVARNHPDYDPEWFMTT